MSTALTYSDLSSAEQTAYDIHLRQYLKASAAKEHLLADGTMQRADMAEAAMKRLKPPYLINLWAAMHVAYYTWKISGITRRCAQAGAQLEAFMRTHAQQHDRTGCVRESFPEFPADIEPWPELAVEAATSPDYPVALHHIIASFGNAAPDERLRLLLDYAQRMPELPAELQNARDTMEHVNECQAPVFLLAQLRDGKVHYYIDVPQDAPTVRGFAGLLYHGLNGATPAAIAATPSDLDVQLGLQKVLSPLRLVGLTALASRMKQNARALATTA
ncbi:MAG: SufE family protein [Candidatus Tectomicrobia bacterium]|uniref:SufE family protein n=1 Tax=Tectimicrobiota bacterium TaxID=2528274 RepID=A0A938B6E2_UNCTE|nr:SufE family protein [Candidatus Tectomicrobia bacterium]